MSLHGLNMLRPQNEPDPHVEAPIFVDFYDRLPSPRTHDIWVRDTIGGHSVRVDPIRGVPLFNPIPWWRRLFGRTR